MKFVLIICLPSLFPMIAFAQNESKSVQRELNKCARFSTQSQQLKCNRQVALKAEKQLVFEFDRAGSNYGDDFQKTTGLQDANHFADLVCKGQILEEGLEEKATMAQVIKSHCKAMQAATNIDKLRLAISAFESELSDSSN